VFAIGARVTIRAGGRTFTRELHAGSSYLSSDEPAVHAGLGPAQRIEEVTVRWPGGPVETFTNLPVNRRMTLRQGDASLPPAPAPPPPALLPAGVSPASASAGS
jgi:enediyne biosynthesis protein E4